jgi:hypothetical protein
VHFTNRMLASYRESVLLFLNDVQSGACKMIRLWPARRFLFLIPALIALFVANGSGPATEIPPQDCQVTQGQGGCGVIWSGIEYLLNDPDPFCMGLGMAAQDRYMAPMNSNTGYHDAPQVEDHEAYVHMSSNSSCSSGYCPTSGVVNVTPAGASITDGAAMANLVAHEERHQDGTDGLYHNLPPIPCPTY